MLLTRRVRLRRTKWCPTMVMHRLSNPVVVTLDAAILGAASLDTVMLVAASLVAVSLDAAVPVAANLVRGESSQLIHPQPIARPWFVMTTTETTTSLLIKPLLKRIVNCFFTLLTIRHLTTLRMRLLETAIDQHRQ
jgi:hypothetical protein